MAAGDVLEIGSDRGRHHVHRVVPHRHGQLRAHQRSIRLGRRGQRLAARAGQRSRWTERRVHLRSERVPDADVQQQQLLGRRGVHGRAVDTIRPVHLRRVAGVELVGWWRRAWQHHRHRRRRMRLDVGQRRRLDRRDVWRERHRQWHRDLCRRPEPRHHSSYGHADDRG